MHCPFCQHVDTRVIDSRVSDDGATIRRRRECEACGERFSTQETVELKLPAIIKSDGRREAFDARKLRLSFDRALHKRPVSEEQVETAVRAVVHGLRMAAERELAIRNLDRESGLLRQVKLALHRIDDGSYGICVHCEEDINPKRLAAVPWTQYCIQCQERADRLQQQGEELEGFEEILVNAA